MFERFTDHARQVVVFAIDEARTHGHNYVGTEHLLVGLLRDRKNAAFVILESNEIDLRRVLARIAGMVGRGDWGATRDLGFTPRAKKALELAVREADALGDAQVDSQHVLLGVAGLEDGLAARVMVELGSSPRVIAGDVLEAMGPRTGSVRVEDH